MTPSLFWVAEVPQVGDIGILDGREGHHAGAVTRVAVGDQIMVADGVGAFAIAAVCTMPSKDVLHFQVLQRHLQPAPQPVVTVVQALPKSERSALAVELATEAGADRIIAWQSSRCVSKWSGPRADKGVQKWRQAAATAAKQSRSPRIPEVDGVFSTPALAPIVSQTVANGGVVAVLHEAESRALRALPLADASSVMLIVGPEGGIAPDELAAFQQWGAHPVRLGPQVVRTSTAAVVALSAIGVLTDRWSSTQCGGNDVAAH